MKWSDGPVTLENFDHRYYDIPEMGYLRWREYTDGQTVVYVHQLTYLAHNPDAPPSDVFSDGDYEVHHGTDDRFSDLEAKCPLFNWGANLRLEDGADHGDWHLNGRADGRQ